MSSAPSSSTPVPQPLPPFEEWKWPTPPGIEADRDEQALWDIQGHLAQYLNTSAHRITRSAWLRAWARWCRLTQAMLQHMTSEEWLHEWYDCLQATLHDMHLAVPAWMEQACALNTPEAWREAQHAAAYLDAPRRLVAWKVAHYLMAKQWNSYVLWTQDATLTPEEKAARIALIEARWRDR